jgi:hypothetical protein
MSTPSSLGRRFTTIYVGAEERVVSVHEDLLCSGFPYFKRLLQPNRKAIEEGCAVCQEEFEQNDGSITHCKTCGNNIHGPCIDEWLRRNAAGGCPFCRAPWPCESTTAQVLRLRNLEPDAFDLYVKWL